MILLDSVNRVFNSELIPKASASLADSEDNISKVVGAGVPAILLCLIMTANDDGGARLLKLAKQSSAGDILDNPGALFAGPETNNLLSKGGILLTDLFGNKADTLSSRVTTVTGSKPAIVHDILSAVALIAFAFIGKHVSANGLTSGGLLNWLNTQKFQIESAMPSGLNLADIFGNGITVHHPTEQVHRTKYATNSRKINRFWLVLLGLLLLGLMWYFIKGCNKPATVTVHQTTPNDAAISLYYATKRCKAS